MISNLVSAIVNGFNGILSGFGSGVADFFQALFMKNTGTASAPTYSTTELSVFATVSIVMIGVALAIGIARRVINMVHN